MKTKGFIRIQIIVLILFTLVLFSIFQYSIHVEKNKSSTITGFAVHNIYPQFATPRQHFNLQTANLNFTPQNQTKQITFSINDTIIYSTAYISLEGNAWIPVRLQSGDHQRQVDNWILDEASISLNLRQQNFTSPPRTLINNNYIIVYSCTRTNQSLDCHNGWQLRTFSSYIESESNDVDPGNGSDEGGDGGNDDNNQVPINETGLVCSFVSDDICPSFCNVNNDVDCYSTIEGTPIENYGANPFYVPIYGKLTVTPNIQSGTSTISYTGEENIFTQDFVGKEFVAFRIHKNPKEENLTIGYYPNVIGSRYATVISVQNGKELTVDFAFNGGSIDQPQTSNLASGYFFFDNRQAFVDAILSTQRTEDIVLQSGKTYVTKGGFDVKPQSHVRIRAEDGFSVRPMIKQSVEDILESPNFRQIWFELGDLEYNIRFSDVNVVGSHYAIPTIAGGFESGLFSGTPIDKQIARTLELRRSDDWAEYYAIRDAGLLDVLPDGYSFIGPSFVKGILYGGRHDGVDVTDFIYLNCLQCDMHIHGFSSSKATVSAGIFKQIIGKSPTQMSQVIHLDRPDYWLTPLQIGSWKAHNYNDIIAHVTFSLDPKTNTNTYVTITGDGSWYQLDNQYWTGGTCQYGMAPNLLLVDGWELFFGSCGNFWWKYARELGWADKIMPMDDAMHARMWEQIPRVGDTILVGKIIPSNYDLTLDNRPLINETQHLERINAREYKAWGLGLQVGDKLEANGELYTIIARERVYHFVRPYWSLNVLDLTFDKDVPSSVTEFTVHTSQTEYLLNGEHEVSLRYDRDLSGHLFYDDYNFPYHFENVYMRGFYRGSDKPTDGHLYLMAPVDENGYGKKWINVNYDGGGFMWSSRTLRNRALAEGKPEFSYPILISGNYSSVPDIDADDPYYDIIKIVGDVKITRAKLWNPIIEGSVRTDEGMELTLTDGWSVEIDEVHMLPDGYGVFDFMGLDGNLVINKFISYPSPINEEYHARLNIKGSASGINYTPHIRINEGIGMIFLSESTDISNVDIKIYNWTPKRFGWGSSVLSVQWDKNHVAYCTNIELKDVHGNSIDSTCP